MKTALNNIALNQGALVSAFDSFQITTKLLPQLPNLQVAFDFTSVCMGVTKLLTQMGDFVLKAFSKLDEFSRLIKFDFLNFEGDPLWNDIFQARSGDVVAASYLADRINWSPNRLQRNTIYLKARITGKSPQEVYREA